MVAIAGHGRHAMEHLADLPCSGLILILILSLNHSLSTQATTTPCRFASSF